MSWPLASHFSAMLQNPQVAFRDPRLQRSVIEKDQRNQPRPWAGAFAVVYKAVSPDDRRPFAVRVFTSESPERRERYELVAAYAKDHKPRCLVEFEYRDQSIRSAGDGKWYPVILMEWVQGETLFNWVRDRCREGNAEAMGFLADRWLDAVKELVDAGIAHGDLQHGNVMVTPQHEIKLVDYDCMCVPALVGRRNLEVGVEPYQHPSRNAKTQLSLDLDHFSALLIYVALRALAAQPQFWTRYVESCGYDKLLFRREDLQSPITSPLYRDLMRLANPEVKELTEQLVALSRAPVDQVPSLGQLVHSYAKVERLLLARQWGAAVHLLNRRGNFRDAPEHLQPLIREAYEFVCRQEAWAAFVRIPPEESEAVDRRVVEAWNEALFAGYPPAEQERPRLAEARRRVEVVDRLRHLAQQSGHPPTLAQERRLVEAAGQLPGGYRHSLYEQVERARKSAAAMARLEAAVGPGAAEAAIVAAWRAVQEARCEYLVGREWNTRVALAQQRVPLLKLLAELPEGLPPDQCDGRLLAVWQEELLSGCAEAEPWRFLYEQAVERKEVLGQLRKAVEEQDEAAIVEWTRQPCLAGYRLPAAWAEPIRAARSAARRTAAMLAALEKGQPAAFYEVFDVRLVRRSAERFAPHQALLAEWIRQAVLPPEKLGLQAAADGESLASVHEAEGDWRVQWTWPAERLADRCLLAVCPAVPDAADDPQAVAAHLRLEIRRPEWDRGGGSRLVRSEEAWEGASVVVWAIVDAGFQTFASRPLVLGRIERHSRWTWKGLIRK
jgi:predicted  nucleic acid-binding Zn-ribbon protein